MKIDFTEDGGATFSIELPDGTVAKESIDWMHVMELGDELVKRSKWFLANIKITAHGTATVTDNPPKPDSDS